MPQPGLSQVLRSLPDGEPVTFSDLAARLGSRAHGLALLILAIPDALPLPVPSVSAILGVPMIAISLHLMLHGEGGGLPGWVGRRQIPAAVLGLLKTRLAGLFAYGERVSHERWLLLAGRERLIGIACLVLSLLLLLPLPFFNTPPAICLALLAWGLIRRDGAFVLAGLVAGAVVVVLLVVAAIWSWELLADLAGRMPLDLLR